MDWAGAISVLSPGSTFSLQSVNNYAREESSYFEPMVKHSETGESHSLISCWSCFDNENEFDWDVDKLGRNGVLIKSSVRKVKSLLLSACDSIGLVYAKDGKVEYRDLGGSRSGDFCRVFTKHNIARFIGEKEYRFSLNQVKSNNPFSFNQVKFSVPEPADYIDAIFLSPFMIDRNKSRLKIMLSLLELESGGGYQVNESAFRNYLSSSQTSHLIM